MKAPLLRLAVAAVSIFFVATTTAAPRPPILVVPEITLKSWRFDQPEAMDTVSLGAHIATNLWLAESWSGYALDTRAQDTLLLTPAVTATYYTNLARTIYRTNFTVGSGTLRLWFAPAWASTTAGGSGPGAWATLFELAQTNTVPNPFGFVLAIDPAGTNLVAAVNTTTGVLTLVEHPISWNTGQWHQIAFVYWPQGVALVVDDAPETFSATVPQWPSSSVWNQSAFSLGTAFDASQPALGWLDEVHTFQWPLSTNYLTWFHQRVAPIAALGPLPEEDGGAQTSSVPSPCDPCPSPGGTNDPPADPPPPQWATNGLRFAPIPYFLNGTNPAALTNFVMSLLGAETNRAYQIFRTTNLLSPPTNIVWEVATNGVTNQVTFTNIVSTNIPYFSYLAARFDDYDQNGTSDAEDWLLNHFDAYRDTDGDGLPDGYELSHGLNPSLVDSDTNGIMDREFVVEWDMTTNPPNGILFDCNGVRIEAGTIGGPVIGVYFDQFYRGARLRPWPRQLNQSPTAMLTNTGTHFVLRYDLRSWALFQNGVRLPTLNQWTNGIEWLDNMTDMVGTNGPVNITNYVPSAVSNIVVRQLQYPTPSSNNWEGIIGNNSVPNHGTNVHAAFYPISKMVVHTNGSDAFYITEYNEGGYDVQKFSVSDPRRVVTFNIGNAHDINTPFNGTMPTNLAILGNTIFVKRNNNTSTSVSMYSTSTGAFLGGTNFFPTNAIVASIDRTGAVAIAVHPLNTNKVAVYYTNGTVKIWTNGAFAYSIGTNGGYGNGPSVPAPSTDADFKNRVKLGPYYYDTDDGRRLYRAALCFEPNGKLWIGDTATGRMLRFDDYGTNAVYDTNFMFIPHTYRVSVDPNNQQRVFNEYLEFIVDYNKPMTEAWTLTNFWGYDMLTISGSRQTLLHPNATAAGLHSVITTTNGRTFALVNTNVNSSVWDLFELTTNGLKATPAIGLPAIANLERDGSINFIENNQGIAFNIATNTAYLVKTNFAGFPSTGLTVEFWMRAKDTAFNGTPISYAISGGMDRFTIFNYRNLQVFVNGSASAATGISLTNNEWVHLAVTWQSSGGILKVYTNAVLAYSNVLASGGTITSGGTFVVGQRQGTFQGGFNTANTFHGQIDELRVWNTVLSQSAIESNRVQELTGSESGLRGYWKLNDDRINTTCADASGNGNTLFFARRISGGSFPNFDDVAWLVKFKQLLLTFDGSGNPQYVTTNYLGDTFVDRTTDPINYQFQVVGTNIIVYHPEKAELLDLDFADPKPFTGYHLGALVTNTASSVSGRLKFLWRTHPTGVMNGLGNFDNTANNYAGAMLAVSGTNLFCLYRGEGWRSGLGGQIFHYKWNGAFVNQFGTPTFLEEVHSLPHPPGGAGNLSILSTASTNGFIYLFTSDEGGTGTHVWRVNQ